jgi:hypothetical protein
MKTKFIILFCWLLLSANAQNINFPDINFKNKLLFADVNYDIARDVNFQQMKIDINNDNEISQFEALQVVFWNYFIQIFQI